MAKRPIWTDDPRGPSSNIVPTRGGINLGDVDHPFAKIFVNEVVVTGLTTSGLLTANGTTSVVVANTAVTADSSILFGLKTVGGTPAPVYEFARTPGVGFTVKSSAGNTSVYNYTLIG